MDLPDLSHESLFDYFDFHPDQLQLPNPPRFPKVSKRPPRPASFMNDVCGTNPDKNLSDEEFMAKIRNRRKKLDPNHMSKRAMKKWDMLQKECKMMAANAEKVDRIFRKGNSLAEVKYAVKQSAEYFLRRQEIEKFVKNSPKSVPKRDTMVLLLEQESCDWERHIKKVMETMDLESEMMNSPGLVKPEYMEKMKKASEQNLQERESEASNFLRAFHCVYVEMAKKTDEMKGEK